jgi:chromosome segregation ATPase
MWQQWFRVPSLRFSTGDRPTVLKFYEATRKDMVGAARRTELMDWLDKTTQPGFANTLAAEAVAVVRREAIRLSFDLEAWSDEAVDARKSLELTVAELETARQSLESTGADLEATRQSLVSTEAELATVRDASEALAVEVEAARAAAQELQATLEAVRGTRTWRLHDRLVRSSVFRWLAHV